MTRIVATRFAQAVPVMFLVAVLTFFLMHLLPGDPAVIIAGDQASPEAIERMRRQLGLDRPVLEQLVLWFARLAQGDFGTSLILNKSVVSAVVERLPIPRSVPVRVVVAVPTSFLMPLRPGHPPVIIPGAQARPEASERMRRQLGLDLPVLEQLVLWIARLAQGDFGTSLILNQSVVSAVVERLPITLSLALFSFVITKIGRAHV